MEKGSMDLILTGVGGEKMEITSEDVRKNLCPTATDKELFIAMGIAKSYGLNPFKREVHIIKYGQSPASVVVGYEVYLKRAERTGKLKGWRVWVDDKEKKAWIEIHRNDWDKPFTWYIKLDEFNKKQSTWNQIPDFMGKKVVIAQGFRLAFPDELGGMPYTVDEEQVYNIGGEGHEPKGKPAVAEPEPLNKEQKEEPKKAPPVPVIEEDPPEQTEKEIPSDRKDYSVAEAMTCELGESIILTAGIIKVEIGKTKKKESVAIYTLCDLSAPKDSAAQQVKLYYNGKSNNSILKGAVIKFIDTTVTEHDGGKVFVGYEDFVVLKK